MRWRGSELREFEDDLWKLGLMRYSTRGATVYRGYCSRLGLWRRLGLEGRKEHRPRGFAHGQQERRVFLLISCLIKLIHLLSLNREDYLTHKQGLDLIPKPNPNGPLGPLNPWHVTMPLVTSSHGMHKELQLRFILALQEKKFGD
jgi:hypothetical protein